MWLDSLGCPFHPLLGRSSRWWLQSIGRRSRQRRRQQQLLVDRIPHAREGHLLLSKLPDLHLEPRPLQLLVHLPLLELRSQLALSPVAPLILDCDRCL